jgi:hypothetical protein
MIKQIRVKLILDDGPTEVYEFADFPPPKAGAERKRREEGM